MAKEKPQAGRARPAPSALPPKTAAAATPPGKIGATSQPLSLKPGRYMIQHLGIEGGSTTIANRIYPFAVLFSPDRHTNGGGVIFAGPDGPGLVRLLAPGDKAIVEVRGGAQPLLFNVYNAPGASSGIRLGLKRVAEANATAAPAVLITAHLQDIGDRQSRGGAWSGVRGSRLRLEGFSIAPLAPELGIGIEFKAGQAEWQKAGSLAGTRGRAVPIDAFAARLAGPKAGAFDVVYQGHFFPSGDTQVLRNGEICRGQGEGDYLVALRMNIVAKGSPLELSTGAAPPKRGRASDVVEVSDAVAAMIGMRTGSASVKPRAVPAKTKHAAKPPRLKKR